MRPNSFKLKAAIDFEDLRHGLHWLTAGLITGNLELVSRESHALKRESVQSPILINNP